MILLPLLAAALALDCKNLGVPGLDKTLEGSIEIESPPTTHKKTVYFNPCGFVNLPSSAPAQCADDEHLCIVEEVKSDKTWVVSGVLPYGSAKSGATESIDTQAHPNTKIGTLVYTGAKWADQELSMSVEFLCGEKDSIEFGEFESLKVTSPSVCLQAANPGKSSSGWGFFHWLFFLLILATIAYVLLAVYANSANSIVARDLHHNIATFINGIASDLPFLIKDFISRITSKFSSSRGGYSAI